MMYIITAYKKQINGFDPLPGFHIRIGIHKKRMNPLLIILFLYKIHVDRFLPICNIITSKISWPLFHQGLSIVRGQNDVVRCSDLHKP